MDFAPGQRVCLNEAGVRFFRPGAGAPRRKAFQWKGRIGVIVNLTRDRREARIHWQGNRVRSADSIPLKFLELAPEVCTDI